jgi:Flp pilus assembly protein TadD
MNNLGVLLGERGRLGEAEAEAWRRRAVDAGDSDAMANLAALRQPQEDPAETKTE